MKRTLIVLIIVINTWGVALAQKTYSQKTQAYIDKYKSWAMSEQMRTGVPAAITLAQGIHETSAGESELCLQANNHFGIKCKKNWTGQTYTYTDDALNECFRKYEDAWSSYKDHSDFLKNNVRYASLFALKMEDYKGWSNGLKQCGYATNPYYAGKLIKLIEDYNLQQYTLEAMAATPKEIVPTKDATMERGPAGDDKSQVFVINNLRAVFCKRGASLLDVAMEHNIRYAKLLEMNDLPDAPVPFDMYVYLQKKPNKGIRSMHTVLPGETMLHVAQAEAIQLKSLLEYNNMQPGQEPQPGSQLYLQEPSNLRPILIAEDKKAVKPAPTTTSEEQYVVVNKEAQEEPLTSQKTITQIEPEKRRAEIPQTKNSAAKEPIIADDTEMVSKPISVEKEEPKPVEKPIAEEPQDELSKLKRRLDKIVYAEKKPEPKPVLEEKPQQKVAPDEQVAPQTPPPAPTPVVAKPKIHVVKKGETAYGIAKHYGISMKELMQWNNLNFQELKVGQKLKVQP